MATFCSVPTCHSTTIEAKGLCNAHYRRLLRHGDPEGGGVKNGSCLDWVKRHSSYVHDDCLIWPFGNNGNGYCRIGFSRTKKVYAHRLMCEYAHGPAPTAKHIAMHLCGNGHLGCLNPRHLRWGTNAENQLQRAADGTHQRGDRHPNSKMTETQAREALETDTPTKDLAYKFGVSYATVLAVRARKSWAWLVPALHSQGEAK